MSDIIEFQNKYQKLNPADLGEALESLRAFGKPVLGVYGKGRGWHASIDMFVSSLGSKFEIKSEFDNKTPTEAVSQLIERMTSALKKLSNG
jgi:hypothetical protein